MIKSFIVNELISRANELLDCEAIEVKGKHKNIRKLMAKLSDERLSSDVKKLTKEIKYYHYDRLYIYAITDGEFVKVGFTNNIKNRIKSIESHNPRKIELIWYKRTSNERGLAVSEEFEFHLLLSAYHVRGEWFSLRAIDALKESNKQETYK